MKTITPLIICAVIALAQAANALTITGFGTGDFSVDSSSFATTNQSGSEVTVIGTDFLSSLFGTLATPVAIGEPSSIQLLATSTGSATSNLQIQLFDSDGDDLLYQANLSSFVTAVPTLVTFAFVLETGTFNGTVNSLGLITTGFGGSVNLSSNTLQVPEPSTALFVGLSLVGGIASRRRR